MNTGIFSAYHQAIQHRCVVVLYFLLLAALSYGPVQAQRFTEVSLPFPNRLATAVAWGDYDNDGRLDLLVLVTSFSGADPKINTLCHNTGNGFEDQSSLLPNMPKMHDCSAAWGDYDNDGKLDLAIAGVDWTTETYITKLYHNTGTGFEDVSTLLPALPGYRGRVAWVDYDNDGRLDLFFAGYQGSVGVRLYRNTGTGFENKTNLFPTFLGPGYPAVAWGDYDNDGRPDLFISGITGSGNISRLYHNTGTGFEDKSSLLPSLRGVRNGSVAWGDYDSDGKLDLLLTGDTGTGSISKLYHNTGTGFDDQTSLLPGLPGLKDGDTAWGDYDNDGRLDLIIGGNSSSGAVNKLYHNVGTGFEDASVELPSLRPGVYISSVAWGDYDNDGKLDLSIAGMSAPDFTVIFQIKVYRNLSPTANLAPNAPSSLTSTPSPDGKSVVLTWQPPTDDHTPSSALNYNLYVSDSPQSQMVVNAMADQMTGFRRVVRLGNSQPTRYTLTGLSQGKTYYWSVQAIDASFAGSPFANPQSFSITHDLLPILYARPSIAYGVTDFSVVVDVLELTGVATATPITLKITRDSRVSLNLPGSVTSVANRSVQNAVWSLNGADPNYYVLTTNAVIAGGNKLSVGLTGQLIPGATTGTLAVSSVLVDNQGEANLMNNADADKMDYFPQ